MRHRNVSLLTRLLVGGLLVAFGYAWAVMRRANRDYHATKAAVGAMRKGFWASLWLLVKIGVGVFLVAATIVAWNVRDFQDDTETPLIPARAEVSPSPVRR